MIGLAIGLADYSYWLALGTIFLQIVIAYLFVEFFFLKEKYLSLYIAHYAPEIVCLTSIAAAAFSLAYSEVYGFIPCGLCWIQRGFLYTTAVLFGIATWKKYHGARDRSIADYGIVLSVVAGVVSLYHHYGQMSGYGLVCPTAGIGADCARRLVFEFGYITLPLMSFTTFTFFIVVFLIYRRIRA